jgi:hypothetical protein
MNTRLKPPCKVLYRGKEYSLRAIDRSSGNSKRFKGLVAKLQYNKGTILVPYKEIEAITS